MTEQVAEKKVTFNYTVKLTDGTIIETTKSENDKPLTITLGKLELLPVIENSFEGKNDGDTYSLNVAHTDAYGEIIPTLIEKVELSKLPENVTIGSELRGLTPENQEFIAFVEDILTEEKMALINANHPLAGKDLVFDIEIVNFN